MNAHLGARPWLARTQYDYAEMLLARVRTENQARTDGSLPAGAEILLDQALAMDRELGMPHLAEQVLALLTSAPARAPFAPGSRPEDAGLNSEQSTDTPSSVLSLQSPPSDTRHPTPAPSQMV
ncbi:MAG: hypothetical protein ACR2PL_16610 [Dehalococcoidia bacterium]